MISSASVSIFFTSTPNISANFCPIRTTCHGRPIYVWATKSWNFRYLFFDEEGGYVAPCLVWTVVTEKVETETKMKRLLRMIDSMPINVMLADPDDMRISYVNQTIIDTLKSL